MKRIAIIVSLLGLVLVIAPPSHAEMKRELKNGSYVGFGEKGTYWTECWSGKAKTKLQRYVNGRWVTEAKSKTKPGGTNSWDGKMRCPKPEYPFIKTYRINPEWEGKYQSAGAFAGLEKVRLREVSAKSGKVLDGPFNVYVY